MNSEDKSEVIKKYKKGVLLRNYSGQLTYEIPNYLYEQYKPAKKKIVKQFSLFPFGFTINGPDEAFQTCLKGSKRIGIEWDVWSGLIFVAKNEQTESLVNEIVEFCENNEI
ncbi:hypothetical protein [Litoribacillus peritrichatus]